MSVKTDSRYTLTCHTANYASSVQ